MRVTMKKGKQKNNATTRAGRKEELTAYLCLIPAFLGVTLISYLPTLAVFVLSLFDWNGIILSGSLLGKLSLQWDYSSVPSFSSLGYPAKFTGSES